MCLVSLWKKVSSCCKQLICAEMRLWLWGLKSVLPLPLSSAQRWSTPGTPRHCSLQTVSDSGFPSWAALTKVKSLANMPYAYIQGLLELEQHLNFRLVFFLSSVSYNYCKISLKYMSISSWKCIRSNLCTDSYSGKEEIFGRYLVVRPCVRVT